MAVNADLIAAYRRERAGYVNRGLLARVALVDAELARLGVKVEEQASEAPAVGLPIEVAVEVAPVETATTPSPRRRKA